MAIRPCACGCGQSVMGRRQYHQLCVNRIRRERNQAYWRTGVTVEQRRAADVDLTPEQIDAIVAAWTKRQKWERNQKNPIRAWSAGATAYPRIATTATSNEVDSDD